MPCSRIGSTHVVEAAIRRSSSIRVPSIWSHAVVGESAPWSWSSPSHWLSFPPPPPEVTVGRLPWSSSITGAAAPHGNMRPPLPMAMRLRPRERPAASDLHRNRSVAPLAVIDRSRTSSRPSAKAISRSSTIVSRGSRLPRARRRLGGPKCGNPRSPERTPRAVVWSSITRAARSESITLAMTSAEAGRSSGERRWCC